MNGLRLPPSGRQAIGAQPRQMLRHRRHAQPDGLPKRRDRMFAVEQFAQDYQPRPAGQRLQHPFGGSRL